MKRVLLTVLFLVLSMLLLTGCSGGGDSSSDSPSTPVIQWSQPDTPRNNHRIGINLSAPADWNTEQPFVDVFKFSRMWISQETGLDWGEGPSLDLDSNAWINSLAANVYVDTPMLNFSGVHSPVGNYTCLYEGIGTIDFWSGGQIISQEPGRIVISRGNNDNALWLRITDTNVQNPLRNIRVVMPGYEETYLQDPFRPDFLQRWEGMNTFRFMDWMETNNSEISAWSDRPTPDYINYTTKGVPVEVMVDLCNRLKINPWFSMPHLATDYYIRKFAEYVRDHLDPTLHIYIEYSNEVWNGMFDQATYAQLNGLAENLSTDPFQAQLRWYSQRSVEVFDIWTVAFGSVDRLVRVMASQAANDLTAEQILSWQNASAKTDALAIAPYFSLNVDENSSPSLAQVSLWTKEDVLNYLESNSIPEATDWMANNRIKADEYGVRLLAYEGGQHAVGVFGAENNDTLTALFLAANRDSRMGELYQIYLDRWVNTGGGDLFCNFSSVGEWGKWGSWGLLEYTDDDTAKYRTVQNWNSSNIITNTLPVVNAGQDATVSVDRTLYLAGSIVDDENLGMKTLTQWTAEGPGEVIFGNSTQLQTSAHFSTPGSYVLILSADDGFARSYDSLIVTVN